MSHLKKKTHIYSTFTARARTCGRAVDLPHVRLCGAASLPGAGKVNRTSTPLPKDYDTAVSVMVTTDLLRSTLTEESRARPGASKTCLLYGLSYFWRPSRCRDHLGLVGSSKQVQVCNPYPEHSDRSSEIVREVKPKWHVRVSKESCKQANRLILWGVGGAPPKKKSRFFLFFFSKKNLKNMI